MADDVTSAVAKLKLEVDGIEKIADLRKVIKNAQKEYDNFGTTITDVHKEYGRILRQQKDRLKSLIDLTRSSNAVIKDSYFQVGEEIRRKVNPSMMSLAQIIQDAPFGLRGMGNNLTMLQQQLTQLSTSGMKMTDVVKGMVGSLSGPMGLMLGGSAVVSLATMFSDKLTPSIRDSAEQLNELNKLMHENGKITDEQYLKTLERRLAELSRVAASDAAPSGLGTALFVGTGGLMGYAGSNGPSAKTLIEIEKLEKEIASVKDKQIEKAGLQVRLENELKDIKEQIRRAESQNDVERLKAIYARKDAEYKAIFDVEKPSTKLADERLSILKLQYELGQLGVVQYIKSLEGELRLEASKKRQLEIQKEMLELFTHYHPDRLSGPTPTEGSDGATGQFIKEQSKYSKGKVPGLSRETQNAVDAAEKAASATQRMLIENSRRARTFADDFKNSMYGVADVITQDVGGAFEGVFGEANSLLEMFLKDLAQGLSHSALDNIIGNIQGGGGFFGGIVGGITSFLGLARGGIINEPVVGVSASGQRIMIGEAGPEAVIPMSEFYRPSSGMDAQVAREMISAIRNIRLISRTDSFGISTMLEGEARRRSMNRVG